MELPTSHCVPLSWLLEHGGESIRYRTLKEIAPPHVVSDEDLAAQLLALADELIALGLHVFDQIALVRALAWAVQEGIDAAVFEGVSGRRVGRV